MRHGGRRMNKKIVFLNGNRICPQCSAMMRVIHGHYELMFECLDCKRIYGVDGQGTNDKELILEEKAG